jgi:xanthine dehydrogenase accessory factor
MMNTACLPASDLDTAEPEWRPAGPDLRDVARQLRPMLTADIPVAIATVLGAHGTVLRRPGTVLVISESGETIGFNPAGPLDGAIRDLAATALATGHDQLERLEIDPDAASYIGLCGGASLDVHARRVQADDPVFGDVLREAGEDDLGGEATIHRPSG